MNPYSIDPNQSYSPPPSDLVPSSSDENFIREGRAVPVGSSIAWLQSGFNTFKAAPGVWIGVLLINFVINFLVGLVPFVGSIVTYVLMPVFTAGFMMLCHAIYKKEAPSVDLMFAGFKNNTGQLALVGLLWFVGIVVIVGALVAFFFASIGFAALGGLAKSGDFSSLFMGMGVGKIIGVVIVGMLMMLVLSAATYFAPVLVMNHKMDAIEAIKSSFSACLKNVLVFVVYFFVMVGAMIVFGVLAAMLGWIMILVMIVGAFVLWPTVVAAIYAAYRQIYFAE
ncbi:BPSS1780 family membrane protein [Undibacterium cyanobacteriorum]|uniref:BPSS1780 family membrane protein n=1 Tax=Undibacterium cyanobacteriorum TaxID=3073561 RepID=A0ABY9RJ52_9BURK|nr:BPSS1780 family membrane protein [Undibacterium sp. 20NA77.5]WMW81258.1 BPSS1780 family membrane protein [Undibacterium sp. 20NA77.5]